MAFMEIDVNFKEIYRYLGYRGITPDESTDEAIKAAVGELREVLLPRSVAKEYPVEHIDEGTIRVGDLVIRSLDLSRNMEGCSRAVMFAATIGLGVDRLIKRAEVTSMMKAAVLQAAGAAFAESYCDMVNREIVLSTKDRGLSAKPRFSPGYGDLSLELQRDFEEMLEMKKSCGISLTDTLLMVPSKSVTAFVGLFEAGNEDIKECEEVLSPHSPESCRVCSMKDDCEFSAYHS